ncbi:DDE superfamily endonuclease [Popillia japonica]|uniref:DDE superfamily endonuclease n=1 Tax=Popillia japonica TaxID=7064 RepID=A0AAW1L1S5_POPJA
MSETGKSAGNPVAVEVKMDGSQQSHITVQDIIQIVTSTLSNDQSRIKLSNLEIAALLPEFGGGIEEDATSWFQRVETVKLAHNVSEKVVIPIVIGKFKGPVLSWYYSKPEYASLTYNELKTKVISMFGCRENRIALMRKFDSRKWKRSESFFNYYQDKHNFTPKKKPNQREPDSTTLLVERDPQVVPAYQISARFGFNEEEFSAILDTGSGISLVKCKNIPDARFGFNEEEFSAILDTGSGISLVKCKNIPDEPVKPYSSTTRFTGRDFISSSLINVKFDGNNVTIENNCVIDNELFLIDVDIDVTKDLISNLNIGKDISFEQRHDFIHMFNSAYIQPARTNSIGLDFVATIKVELNHDKFFYRPRRLSYADKQTVHEITNDLVNRGIIRKCSSPYASPIVLVNKKNGAKRMCVDYRDLNKIVVKDRFPIPNIVDQIDGLHGKKWFSKLDLKDAFHNIKLDSASTQYTSFVTFEGQFEYLKLPFGFCNSPSIFARFVSDLKEKVEFSTHFIFASICRIHFKMGMCWIPGCTHYNNRETWCTHYNNRETCTFFTFPKPETKEYAQWVKLIRRDAKPGPGARVCSCHFEGGLRENLPTKFPWNVGTLFQQHHLSPEKKKARTRVLETEYAVLPSTSKVQEADLAVNTEHCEPSVSTSTQSDPLPSTALLEAENYLLGRTVEELQQRTSSIPFSLLLKRIELVCQVQKSTYSTYKQRNTWKGLVGVAPNGVVTFVSKLYPGSTSDKKIVQHCGILQHLEAGDLILADKGFLIHDILPAGVSLNIPPFLTTSQFTEEQVRRTASIAKARVHVERAIRRMKCYSILNFIPDSLIPEASIVFRVVGALTNLQYPLIKEVEEYYITS